jgi:hypothetical protein
MGRPKLPIGSAEISAEIARLQAETQAHLLQLEERRRIAETRENQRRGELIMAYLSRPAADDLRQALRHLVEESDRSLFMLDDSHGGKLASQ